METLSNTPAPEPAGWTPGAALPVEDADVHQLAKTFAVTPEAVRLAVARVGANFRDLQRELGGRR